MTTQLRDRSGEPLPAFRRGTVHKIDYTTAAGTIGVAISENCRLVLVWCSTDAHIAIGPAAAATTSDWPITAKTEVPVVVDPGDLVSAIEQADDGTLYVTELI